MGCEVVGRPSGPSAGAGRQPVRSLCPPALPPELENPASAGSCLLLGLGNDILSDDAVGLLVARQLREELAGDARFEVSETTEMGLALLDFLVGRRAAVVVDAIQTGDAPPGTIHEVEIARLPQLPARTPHFLGVGETLALGCRLGLLMPRAVRVLAVEVADPFTLGTVLSPAVAAALPEIVGRAKAALRSLAGDGWSHRSAPPALDAPCAS